MDNATNIPAADLTINISDVMGDSATETTTDVTLTKAQINAILLFASDDESRVNLNQVWFQGSHVFATDGHRLAAFGPELTRTTCQIDHDAGFGLVPAHLKAAAKSMRLGDSLRITDTGSTLRRKDGTEAEIGSMLGMADDDCRFPPVAQVIPWTAIANADRSEDRGCPWVHAGYLADAAQAPTLAGYTRKDRMHHIRIIASGGDLDPVAMWSRHTAESGRPLCEAIVVVMPVRV